MVVTGKGRGRGMEKEEGGVVIDGRKRWCRFFNFFFCIFGVIFYILYGYGVFRVFLICILL